MNWKDLEDALHWEERALEQPCQALDGLRYYERAQAALALEAVHRVALAHAVQQRVASGCWPDALCAEIKYLLRLRIRAVRQHVAWLSVLDEHAELTVARVLAVFADREWPRFRYEAHLDDAEAGPASVDDPFADHLDSWAQ